MSEMQSFVHEPGRMPYWTLGLMAVGLVSRESIVRAVIERQEALRRVVADAAALTALAEDVNRKVKATKA